MRHFPPTAVRSNLKPPWRVLFFGTDEFSLPTLQALNENRMFAPNESKLVETLHIAHPWMKKASPVMKYATLNDLNGYNWPIKRLDSEYDIGVLASFGHLIPSRLVNAFNYGIINVHPSLLPRWRGAAPLHHTLLNGDSVTGISIMSIQPKVFDCGPLLAQRTVEVPPRCSQELLRDILAHKGSKMILEIFSDLSQSIAAAKEQSNEGVCYAHKITQSNSFIDWKNQTVRDIDCQYRALHQTTELRTDWQGTTIRLLDMLDIRHKPDIRTDVTPAPGLPVYNKADGSLWVRCKGSRAGVEIQEAWKNPGICFYP
ncbi:methionyl-tRNA formyltransferase, mitochondrial [Elysia marginata]|uniref:methionyl-tRNA formyltransferase n=1 Tax=Elysia marginata TaxID=1093978 RepID=A0AAV4I2C4_9GAST|nr:methionyl-tRNA formyltransferase, mitochondrial [Elysia marginata]